MPNPVVHFEIGCRDRELGNQFYTQLFGWGSEDFGPLSKSFDTGSDEGISGHLTALGHEPHNYVMIYVQVDDIGSYLERAEGLGGKTLVPENEVPGQGKFAWMQDPDGNTIGLWKPLDGE